MGAHPAPPPDAAGVDPIFGHPRLAAVYDAVDGPRHDLDAYLAVADEVGAGTVLDVGCGTGTFACLLAARGVRVVGADPAAASLAVARTKPHADRVRWVHAGAADVPPVGADLAVMTGNVAQVFLADQGWAAALAAIRAALRPGGTLVFEVRDPARRAWEGWVPGRTRRRLDVPGVGGLETWTELLAVDLPLVSFRHVFRFAADGAVLTSRSTLRFRTRPEVEASVAAAGLDLVEVRDAPDRPGLEWVVVARRP